MNDLPLSPTRTISLSIKIRGAGHVAAIFQHGDEEEQHHDLRQKGQHPADAAESTPSTNKLRRAPSAIAPSTARPSQSAPRSMRFIAGSAHTNTA